MTLISPLITEQSLKEAAQGRLTFRVALSANKNQIAAAIARLYPVHPVKVATAIVKGTIKKSLRRRKPVQTADYKKAMVTLRPGEKIDLFDISTQQAKT